MAYLLMVFIVFVVLRSSLQHGSPDTKKTECLGKSQTAIFCASLSARWVGVGAGAGVERGWGGEGGGAGGQGVGVGEGVGVLQQPALKDGIYNSRIYHTSMPFIQYSLPDAVNMMSNR